MLARNRRWTPGLTAAGLVAVLLLAPLQHPVQASHTSRLTLESVQDHVDDLQAGIAGKRVWWSPTLGYAKVDGDVAEATERAARRFAELGAEVEEGDPGLTDPTDFFLVLYQGAMAGNFAHLFELGVTGKFQCAADFLPGLPGVAGRFLTITCKLIPDHPFGMRLLFIKVRKKILRFNLAAAHQNDQ